MATPEFDEAILNLRRLARAEGPVALMCAEAVPWRCHRSLIADALVVRRDAVTHIMDPGSSRPHELTPWAKVEGTTVTYPGPPPERPSGSRGIAAGRGRRRATQEQLL